MSYRILFVVFAGLLVISLAFADVPKQINFQGRLTDSEGKFVTDGDYSLTFRLYSDSTGGSLDRSCAAICLGEFSEHRLTISLGKSG